MFQFPADLIDQMLYPEVQLSSVFEQSDVVPGRFDRREPRYRSRSPRRGPGRSRSPPRGRSRSPPRGRMRSRSPVRRAERRRSRSPRGRRSRSPPHRIGRRPPAVRRARPMPDRSDTNRSKIPPPHYLCKLCRVKGHYMVVSAVTCHVMQFRSHRCRIVTCSSLHAVRGDSTQADSTPADSTPVDLLRVHPLGHRITSNGFPLIDESRGVL